MNLESSFAEITKKLDSHTEWLLIGASGKSFPVQRGEIEFTFEREKIIFGFLSDAGFQIWRVADCKIEPENITLDLTRNFERELEKIRLVPRISASKLREAVELARLERANQIARLIVEENRGAKLLRVSLNDENARFAQITFKKSDKQQIAVLADIADVATPENLLTTAIFRLAKLENRKKPIETVWILAEKKLYKNLRKLHALLRESWKSKICVKEISCPSAKAQREEILEIPPITFGNLWREKPPKISLAENTELSETAAEIIKLAPEKIDVIFTKHGETVRFFGLPFARVRRIADGERAWFGIERDKRILNENSRAEFFDLFENLQIYRRFDSPNKRHALFRLAPEAWLEFLLRRNIKLLDGNLILSPIHNQFRAANDTIDLLALRRDGRLIVIELKIAPDREMIFQAVDYWRKIELQRRSGSLASAKIFGDLEISNEPTLVFLAAPTLSFHRDFEFLAKTVSPEIEIYKFGLNENWRENLKVMKVSKVEK